MTNHISTEMKNCNVLLTGATGGMGKAFSQLLFDKGANLDLIGRNSNKLKQHQAELLASNMKADNKVEIFAIDLVESLQRKALIAYLATLSFDINLLINNAGISQFSLLEQTSESDINSIISTNTIAPIQLTKA